MSLFQVNISSVADLLYATCWYLHNIQ